MEAKATQLTKFLNGPKQFLIPIFQRTYSWKLSQCSRLWNDIVKLVNKPQIPGHFIGSVVYIQKGLYQTTNIPELLLIDGQHRLATVSLLLSALGRALQERGVDGSISQKKINNYYLFNPEEDGDLHYKLILTQSDKQSFIHLLEGREMPDHASRLIVDNFHFFEEQIAKADINLEKLYQGIAKLLVVDIALDREHDNPQLIFESLNSTGLELTQADLIRNYVLMGLEPRQQEKLYNDYWYPMEQSLGNTDDEPRFDRFMRDYLTIKTRSIPNIRQVYDAFKLYVQNGDLGPIEAIVSDIHKYSKYFVYVGIEKEADKELREIFHDINTLKVEVAYPFLMEVYDDYVQAKLTRSDFIDILKLIESYVFRRAICGIPTNSLNKTFATLAREINKEKYLESFKAILLLKTSYRLFPNNDEFIRELIARDLYNFRNRNYWLRKLENYDRKELVDVEGYTIEHIMPQNENLSSEWQNELGSNWKEIQTRYLHTLGNLTLTGYNPELSDRSFVEKRDMKGGFADSPIRLNRDLAKLNCWNETEIPKRAQVLSQIAIKVWTFPNLSQEVLDRYRKDKKQGDEKIYTLEDHPLLKGEIGQLFDQIRKHILNLDACVTEEILKKYIAYKNSTNFVDVVPKTHKLRLHLNMKFSEINDPKSLCEDVTGKGHWGNGDVKVNLSSPDQIEYVMTLIRQSFDKHMDYGDE